MENTDTQNTNNSTPERFRIDEAFGKVYEWDTSADAYLFYCSLLAFDPDRVDTDEDEDGAES